MTEEVYVNFGMAGSFPLRVADLVFGPDRTHLAEYAHVTPLFGLGRGSHRREAERMCERYAEGGRGAVLAAAERVVDLDDGDLQRVVCYTGGRVGRPKVALETQSGPPYGYRLHGSIPARDLASDLRDHFDGRPVAIECRDAVGYSLRESLARFRADR